MRALTGGGDGRNLGAPTARGRWRRNLRARNSLQRGDVLKHENGAYWPTLLSEEPTLSDLGIYVHTYQTSIASGYYSVGDACG